MSNKRTMHSKNLQKYFTKEENYFPTDPVDDGLGLT